MSRSRLLILSGAAITIMSGCSSAAVPEKTASQTQPLAASTSAAFVSGTVPVTPATVATGVLTVLDAGVQSANAAQLALADATEVAKLRGMALGVSSVAGVLTPTTMQVVAASDHQAAEYILSGAVINDHAPVYVIKMAGGPFTAPQHPVGVPAPQGNFLTVTLNAATLRVTDVGYVNVEPDLSTIGTSPMVDLASP